MVATENMEQQYHVRFEGYGVTPEIWGAQQANFLITGHGGHARESAVMLNEPASQHLAELLGTQDDDTFRRQASRFVGQLWIERLLERGEHVPPAVTISKATLEADPDLIERIRALVAK